MIVHILIYYAVISLLILSNHFLFSRSSPLYTFYGFSANNTYWYGYGGDTLNSCNDISNLFSTVLNKIQVTFVDNKYETIVGDLFYKIKKT